MAGKSLKDRLADWLQGRNGSDELGTASLVVSLIFLLVNGLTHQRWLSAVSLAFAAYACWRVLSRQVAQRRAENQAFLQRTAPIVSWVKNPAAAVAEARAYKHLSCPSCHQRVRVPRGKGRLRVTCPSCRTKFETRS